MDNAWIDRVEVEAGRLGVGLAQGAAERLAAHVDLVLRWNAKVNLTRIVRPLEVLAKNVVDSLAALAVVPPGPIELADFGSGAGYPGIPWLIARPDLGGALIDASARKVAFLKTALAELRLARARAVQVRATGHPSVEGVGLFDLVVSRAFMPMSEFLALARPYLRPAGQVVAMLGPVDDMAGVERAASERSYRVAQVAAFDLPESSGRRTVLRLVPRGTLPVR